MDTAMDTPLAVVTGASRGLGRALAGALNERGWRLVVDGRGGDRLARTGPPPPPPPPRPPRAPAAGGGGPAPPPGAPLAAAAGGRLDLLVNNASELGPSP